MLICPGRLMSPPRRASGGAEAPSLLELIPGLSAYYEAWNAADEDEALTDLTGNGHTFTTTFADAFSIETINGSGALYMGNVLNVNHGSPAVEIAGTDQPFSLAFLLRDDVNDNAGRTVFRFDKNGGSALHYAQAKGAAARIDTRRVDDTATAKQQNDIGGHLGLNLGSFIYEFSGTTATTYVNGAVVASSIDLDVGVCSFDRMFLGAAPGPINRWTGILQPVAFQLDGNWTSQNRADINENLAARYGISL